MTAIYNRTAIQICNRAARLLGISQSGKALSGSELNDFIESLNLVIKELPAKDLPLWTETEGVVFSSYGATNYLLGPSGDYACNDDDLVEMTVSTAASAGAFVLYVDTTEGVTVGDTVGVCQSRSAIQWTTIASKTDESIQLSTTLSESVAAGKLVFCFTDLIERPLRILSARLDGGDFDLPMRQIDREEYFTFTSKSNTGTPTQYHYSPQLTNGRLYVWPASGDVGQKVRFTYQRSLVNMTSSSSPDLPDEWGNYLGYALAWHMLPEYPDVIASTASVIETRMAVSEAALKRFNSQGSVFFYPE